MVDCTALEMRQAREGFGGSNPPASAKFFMNVKKLSSDDWEKLRDIRLAGLKSDPQAFGGVLTEEMERKEIGWRERIDNPNRFFFAIEENNSLLSLAGAINSKDEGWMLVAVYTLPEARGRGFAKKLTERVIEEVKKNGAEKISLMVNVDQLDAVHVYEKSGFKITKRIRDQKMGDGILHDEYYMERVF